MDDPLFSLVIELADASVARFEPGKLKWMWGDALYICALSRLDDALGQERYLGFNRAWLDAHISKGYRVDQSDTMAPGLTAFATYGCRVWPRGSWMRPTSSRA
jgi:rhamnogalacturonyl hydrolase YesR